MRRPEPACPARSRFDPYLHPVGTADAPGHARRVVGQAVAAVRTEQDDAAVTTEAAEKIGDGGLRSVLGSVAAEDAIDGPLAEHQFHDGLAPPGERDGSAEIVCITAAANERGVANAAGGFVERATSGGGGGEIAASIERDRTDGVV